MKTPPRLAGNAPASARALLLGALLAAGCGGEGANLFNGVGIAGDDEEEEEPGSGGLVDAFDLSYSFELLFTDVGVALDPQVPVASTLVQSYMIEPELPAGLDFNTVTGVLSGTPTERATLDEYLITGFSEQGSAEFELAIQVLGRSRYAYVANRGDNTISIFAMDNENGALHPVSYHLQSPFELGPEQLCLHPDRGFLFSINDNSNTLSSVRIDSATGLLESADATSIGSGAHHIVAHPDGRFLYLVSNATDALRTYQFDESSGSLAQIGDTVTVLERPTSVHVAPNGRYIVVVHETGFLSTFVVEPTSGQPIFSSELLLFEDAGPRGAVITPRSDALYVTLPEFDSLVELAIDPLSGFMTLGITRETEIDPSPPILTPDGARVYVFNADSSASLTPSVSVYDIDESTGVIGEPTHQELAFEASRVELAPDGDSMLLMDDSLPGPRWFDLSNSTGLLTERGAARARELPRGLLILDGNAPVSLRATNVYVANREAGDITTFVVSTEDGSLSPLGSPTPGGNSAADLAVDPLRRFLWLANDSPGKESVITYALLSEGLPAQTEELLFGVRPTAVAVDPTGRFVYVATDDLTNALFAFAVQAGGSLSVLEVHEVGNSPAAIEIDPTGQFLYVVNSGAEEPGDQGSIHAFKIDCQTGLLTPVPPPAFAGGRPTHLAFSPDGGRAYSAFANTDLVSPYTIDAETGAIELQLVASMTGNEPVDLVLSPNGKLAWLAVFDSPGIGRVDLFDVRAEDGVLFDVESGQLEPREFFISGANPTAIELEPGGEVLYVLSQGSATVMSFEVDSDDGGLIQLDVDATGFTPVALEISSSRE